MLERESKKLVEFLIRKSKTTANEKKEKVGSNRMAPILLGSCLANEIQISPELLEEAIEWYAKNRYVIRSENLFEIILKTKFGETFLKTVKTIFFKRYDDKYFSALGSVLGDCFIISNNEQGNTNLVAQIREELNSDDKQRQCSAILVLMIAIFSRRVDNSSPQILDELFSRLMMLLSNKDIYYIYSISWCLAWAGERTVLPDKHIPNFATVLFKFWQIQKKPRLHRIISWAFCSILTPDIPKSSFKTNSGTKKLILNNFASPTNEYDKLAATLLAIIIGGIVSEAEVKKVLKNYRFQKSKNISLFLKHLGVDDKTD